MLWISILLLISQGPGFGFSVISLWPLRRLIGNAPSCYVGFTCRCKRATYFPALCPQAPYTDVVCMQAQLCLSVQWRLERTCPILREGMHCRTQVGNMRKRLPPLVYILCTCSVHGCMLHVQKRWPPQCTIQGVMCPPQHHGRTWLANGRLSTCSAGKRSPLWSVKCQCANKML